MQPLMWECESRENAENMPSDSENDATLHNTAHYWRCNVIMP